MVSDSKHNDLILRCFRLWIAYRGDNYCGFQAQTNGPTIEGELSKALYAITQQTPEITVAGRTDSGVHAEAQVVSITLLTRLAPRNLKLALQQKLPQDIAVWHIDAMPLGFDARRQSVGKQYIYRIYQGEVAHPLLRLNSWHVKKRLDVDKMRQAAEYFIGEHDFESFRSTQCTSAHAQRYLWHFSVHVKANLIEFDIRGNAFCLNMVRIMVGTLVEVGLLRKPPEYVGSLLTLCDRTLAGRTARPEGLTFNRVYYPDDLKSANIPDGALFPRYPVTKESWPFDASCV